MSYRDKPTDLKYKAIRWTDVLERTLPPALAAALFGSVMALAVTDISDHRQKRRDDRECRIACHPAEFSTGTGDCWCFPSGAKAYREEQ